MARINTVQGFTGYSSVVANSVEPEYIGAKMVFAQGAAPAGWVKITDYDDYSLRVVSGTGGVASSSNQPFSTVYTTDKTLYQPETGSWSLGATNPTTISIAQMAPHAHPSDSSSGAGLSGYTTGWPGTGPGTPFTGIVNPVNAFPAAYGGLSGGGGGHAHASGTVTGITYSSPFNFNIKYKDVILAKYC